MFKFYPDASVRSLALETGEAGIVEDIPPVDARLAAGSGAYQVQPQPIPGQPLQFILNTVRAPTDGLSFRQALILSANRPEIVRSVFQGYSSVAYGPLSSSTLYFDAGLEGRYAYDVAQAVALLNSSGWVDSNGDGWRDDPTGMPMRINLVIPPWGMIPEVAQLLATQWEKNLNIQVHLTQVASLAMLSSAAEKGDYHIIALNFFGLDPIILNEFYLSGGLRNWSHYSDAELDQWLVEAQQEENEDRRRALYSLIQNRIMDQVLIVPIRDYVNLNGIQSGIHGLHFDAQGWFPYLTDIAFGQ
jgi:peptide/nickel transport system substrate-binding protein